MPQQPWRRRRFWHCPAPHALLHSAAALPNEDCVRMHGHLDRPAAASLHDFRVLPLPTSCQQQVFSSLAGQVCTGF
jgi:hypothetical protein